MKSESTSGLMIAGTGALLSIIGWAASERADGLGGVIYAPIVYGGVFIFIFGIIRAIAGYRQWPSRTRILTMILVAAIVLSVIVGTIISTRDNNREKYCFRKYNDHRGVSNLYSDYEQCLQRQIN